MAIDFPASPTNGQTYVFNGVTYTYDGTKWTAETGSVSLDKIEEGNTSAEVIDTGSDGRFVVTTEGTPRATVDSAGRLLVGTSANRTGGIFQIETADSGLGRIHTVTNNAANTISAVWKFIKSRGSSVGASTSVISGDDLGTITFAGTDGTNTVDGAYIGAQVDAAVTTNGNEMPTRLVFSTTADGATWPTERMRIGNSGHTWINSSDFTTLYPGEANTATGFFVESAGKVAISRNNTNPLVVNRNTSDGTLIDLRQDGNSEGAITVSGSTVSLIGAHLSRWSQLPGGAERTEILRGTVLSNIDEMCAWGDEDNEQLNRMKVSDVEGDPNVSGVFQSWDDDDDTYTDDFHCAMTGDFIIRIAGGVPVHKGQLLMSAGDGTAKPQDDDIIRSKTIAKVTSNHVTCTYDDGSYCVPCVLMAC
jgi:hypothetical protein